jgi:SAM-dependent methyltransferase
MGNTCRLCSHSPLTLLLDLGKHPIAHRFLESPKQDEYVHSLILFYCDRCGFIQIDDPMPADHLYSNYNWLSAWKAQPHMARLIEGIKSMPNITPSSRLLEAGCNDGSFLQALKQSGFNNLLGVEPAKDASDSAKEKKLDVIHGYFNQPQSEHILSQYGACDLFAARQVLEHIQNLDDFSKAVQRVLAPNGSFLIEVPDFEFCLTAPDYSGIWEEHVNYFTKDTLRLFFEKLGVDVSMTETFLFSGKALAMLGQRKKGIQPDNKYSYMSTLRPKIEYFKNYWTSFRSDFLSFLKENKGEGKRIAVYGGGCRAAGLINFSGAGPLIDVVLDDQPEKQGKYMPGSRLAVLPSSEMAKQKIDLCLLMVNAENEEKVLAKNREFKGQWFSFHPPSARLPKFWKKSPV